MNKTKLTAFAGACVLATVSSAGAISLDLTTAGSSGTVNGALFQQIDPQSTGTGVIDPFLRVQATGTEAGFNTGLSPMPDVKTGTWTHELLLTDVPIVTIGGVQYYQFLLDINQTSANPLLSLHELEIWTKSGTLAEANSYDDLAAGGATKKYDLDSGPDGDSKIELNYLLNPGSGAGDMFAYIPVAVLGTGSLNVYLYCEFGAPNATNDGFEEWAVLKAAGTTGVPDASTSVALLGMGLIAVGTLKRRLLS
jgi:hypothetical protein